MPLDPIDYALKKPIEIVEQLEKENKEELKNYLSRQSEHTREYIVEEWNKRHPDRRTSIDEVNAMIGYDPTRKVEAPTDLTSPTFFGDFARYQEAKAGVVAGTNFTPKYSSGYPIKKKKGLFHVPKTQLGGLPLITPPKMTDFIDFEKLQEDIYEGMRSKIMDEAAQMREKLKTQFSKLGLYRSGLLLKQIDKLDLNTLRALGEAWGDAAIDVAKIQADLAKKQGDWELAAKIENAANYLRQLQIITGHKEKVGELGVQLYGIDTDREIKYDLASLDYLKSMNLANMDTLTRITTSYGQWVSDWVKQALANKNYSEAAKIKDDVIKPLFNALLPSVVSWLGKNNPDTEELQEGYQQLYGITVSEEDINELIDKVNELTEWKESLNQPNYLNDYDYLGG